MTASPQTDSTRNPARGRARTGSGLRLSYSIETLLLETRISDIGPRGNAGARRPVATGRDSFVDLGAAFAGAHP